LKRNLADSAKFDANTSKVVNQAGASFGSTRRPRAVIRPGLAGLVEHRLARPAYSIGVNIA
jgi:hypothetical protein